MNSGSPQPRDPALRLSTSCSREMLPGPYINVAGATSRDGAEFLHAYPMISRTSREWTPLASQNSPDPIQWLPERTTISFCTHYICIYIDLYNIYTASVNICFKLYIYLHKLSFSSSRVAPGWCKRCARAAEVAMFAPFCHDALRAIGSIEDVVLGQIRGWIKYIEVVGMNWMIIH